MYNLNSHYEFVFESLRKILKHRRLIYLFPFGTSKPENIETITDDLSFFYGPIYGSPMFIFYDQEPINYNYNYLLFDYIKQKFRPPFILVTTERDSESVQTIANKYNWPVIDYFFHIFAASDWYRGYKFNEALLPLSQRKINKKFITFNRITGNSRVYRSIFIAELSKRKLLDFGHISYSKVCPVHGHYKNNILQAHESNLITSTYADSIINELNTLDTEFKIDHKDRIEILNDSMTLGPIKEIIESFVYVVTETCFWETKKHLTEKIFKPIVAKQPFILLGCAYNLAYLKEYGFKTFDKWWDESYDNIEDPIDRLQAVVSVLEKICQLDNESLHNLLLDMQSVLDHNYNLFYSENFIQDAWGELQIKINNAVVQHAHQTSVKN